VTGIGFLSPANAAAGVTVISPLRHAIADGVVDLSYLGKLELRGAVADIRVDPGEDLLRLSPRRALLVTEGSVAAATERLGGPDLRAYDMTAALAALEIEGEDVMRRLTELDLTSLPTAGAIARGTRAVIERRDGERFRIFVAQELGHYVVEVVLDTLRGLGR